MKLKALDYFCSIITQKWLLGNSRRQLNKGNIAYNLLFLRIQCLILIRIQRKSIQNGIFPI